MHYKTIKFVQPKNTIKHTQIIATLRAERADFFFCFFLFWVEIVFCSI